eukprot:TRINITY_DN33_c0_g1_i1.p1 TRINITY_DN33_c0_g1~~TRINITY_DN33_c0_g1_i1.p1  ORF type:complete len:298 (-),score=91.67 TRINITY_DN33_c0_g1_i1:83-976(-)
MNKIRALQKRVNYFNEMNKLVPSKWKNSFLCEWFTEVLEYPQYVEALKKKRVNGEKFMLIIQDKQKLKKLGITKLGHIKNIKKYFLPLGDAEIKEENSSNNKENEESVKLNTRTSKSPNRRVIDSEENLELPQIKQIGDKVFEWEYDDVLVWLRSLKMECYFPYFKENSIRGDILLDLNEKLLKELGIASMGQIKRILKSIQKLYPSYFNDQTISSSINSPSQHKKKVVQYISQWDVKQVNEWMDQIGLSIYRHNIEQQKIDGSVLMKMNSNDLIEIGINVVGHRKKILTEIDKLIN